MFLEHDISNIVSFFLLGDDDEVEEEDQLEVGERHFLEALKGFEPSVSREDLQYYESVKNAMDG